MVLCLLQKHRWNRHCYLLLNLNQRWSFTPFKVSASQSIHLVHIHSFPLPFFTFKMQINETWEQLISDKGTIVSKYRWVVCSVFAMRMIIGSMFMTALAPISIIMVNTYQDLSTFMTTFILMILTIMYIPFNFPSNYAVDRFGLSFGMYAGTIPLIIGAWIWCFQGSAGTGVIWLVFA